LVNQSGKLCVIHNPSGACVTNIWPRKAEQRLTEWRSSLGHKGADVARLHLTSDKFTTKAARKAEVSRMTGAGTPFIFKNVDSLTGAKVRHLYNMLMFAQSNLYVRPAHGCLL
jgi:hypothetical protein